MTVSSFWFAVRPDAWRMLVLLASLAVVADADARGRRGGIANGIAAGLNHSRPSPSSSPPASESSPEVPVTGSRIEATGTPGGSAKKSDNMSPEEATRREALLEAAEREQAQKAAARTAAAEKAEAERIAAEKAAAAKKAAQEKAKADQLAAELRKKEREQAAVASDVDRVLKRARADYPVLNSPEGQPLMERIMEKQRALVATGMYPSVAMVEAVADHADLLQAAAKPQPAATRPAEQAAASQPQSHGGCRWITPIQWACK